MKKPPINAMRGLRELARVVDAGACDDILGFAYENAPREDKQRWRDVEAAVRWIEGEITEPPAQEHGLK